MKVQTKTNREWKKRKHNQKYRLLLYSFLSVYFPFHVHRVATALDARFFGFLLFYACLPALLSSLCELHLMRLLQQPLLLRVETRRAIPTVHGDRHTTLCFHPIHHSTATESNREKCSVVDSSLRVALSACTYNNARAPLPRRARALITLIWNRASVY